jgi:hypothetical protein
MPNGGVIDVEGSLSVRMPHRLRLKFSAFRIAYSWMVDASDLILTMSQSPQTKTRFEDQIARNGLGLGPNLDRLTAPRPRPPWIQFMAILPGARRPA